MEKEYFKQITEFEIVLTALLTSHFDILDKIGNLLKKEMPTNDDLDKLKKIAVNYASVQYFFERVNKNWFSLLKNDGVFETPSPIIKHGTKLRFVKWPASVYLRRMIQYEPKSVFEVMIKCKIPSISSERNVFVIEDFLDIACEMPIGYARKIANLFVSKDWLYTPYLAYSIQQKSPELAMKLLENNYYEGVKIVSALISIKNIKRKFNPRQRPSIFKDIDDFKRNPFRNMDAYYLKQIAENLLPLMFDKFPKATFELLCKKLVEILSTYEWIHDKIYVGQRGLMLFMNEYADLPSTSWVQSLDEPNLEEKEPRSFFVKTILQQLLMAGTKNRQELKNFVFSLAKYRFPIFRRIEMYIYGKFPDLFTKEIDSAIVEYFDDYETYHEHYLLLEQFGSRRKKIKQIYFRNIRKKERSLIKELERANYSKENIEKQMLHWMLRLYEPIVNFLSRGEKKWYKNQIKKGYSVSFKGFTYEIKVIHDFKEGKDIGLTSDMSPNSVLDILTKYLRSNNYSTPDEINLSKFGEAVKHKPYEYSLLANETTKLNVEYSYKLMFGLEQAVQIGSNIVWSKVLKSCKNLLNNSHVPHYLLTYRFGNAIADLLSTGISKSTSGLSFDQRKNVWLITKKLIKIMLKNDNRLLFLEKEDEIRKNYSDMIFNSDLGSTITLLVKYVIWCHTELRTKNGIINEAKKLLEQLIRNSSHRKPEILGTLSFHLNNLIIIDEEWVSKNLEKQIFVPRNDNKILYYLLWECYLLYNQITIKTFSHLFPFFIKRVEDLKYDPSSYDNSERIRSLIILIINAYLYKLSGSELLLNIFLGSASSKIKSIFLGEIGLSLQRHRMGKFYGFDLDRIKNIWNMQHLQDYPEFIKWFIYSPIDKHFSILKLKAFLERNRYKYDNFPEDIILFTNLIEELNTYVLDEPIPSLDCVLIVSEVANQKGFLGNIKDIVLQLIIKLKNKNKAIQRKVQNIRNFYGVCGYDLFR
jgi:hypothetical protein